MRTGQAAPRRARRTLPQVEEDHELVDEGEPGKLGGERRGEPEHQAEEAAVDADHRPVPVEERVRQTKPALGVVHPLDANVGHLQEALALDLRLIGRVAGCQREGCSLLVHGRE